MLQAMMRAGCLLIALFAAIPVGAQDAPTGPTIDWKARLSRMRIVDQETYDSMSALNELDSATLVKTLTDNWPSIPGETVRCYLLNMAILNQASHTLGQNLAIMNLGATDTAQSVRTIAFLFLRGYAMRDFSADPQDYPAWYAANADRPLAEIIARNARQFAESFRSATPSQKPNYLQVLENMDLASGSAVAGMRRQALIDGRMFDSLAALIGPGAAPDLAYQALMVLSALRPDPAYSRRLVLPLVQKTGSPQVVGAALRIVVNSLNTDKMSLQQAILPLLDRANPPAILQLALTYAGVLGLDEDNLRRYVAPIVETHSGYVRLLAIALLRSCSGTWASELIARVIVEEFPSPQTGTLVQTLALRHDPHTIPLLISLLDAAANDAQDSGDAATSEAYAVQGVQYGLSQLAGVPFDEDHDAHWWHAWWDQNRARLGDDLRDAAIPVVKRDLLKSVGESLFSVRRGSIEAHVAGDPQRAYWLISPGYVFARKDGDPLPTRVSDVPIASRPGLIVVLTDEDAASRACRDYWLQAAQKAFACGYLLAVASAPGSSSQRLAPWITKTGPASAAAPTTAEVFVSEIVKDVAATYPINPSRCFLHGCGDSGAAVYACSLDAETPFRGFYVLDTRFQSTKLPPLSYARGRRFFIEHSREDAVAPYFTAEAAQSLLKSHGAAVRLATCHGPHGYNFDGDAWSPLSEAIAWLESGK